VGEVTAISGETKTAKSDRELFCLFAQGPPRFTVNSMYTRILHRFN
jgi:hypothetical protein